MNLTIQKVGLDQLETVHTILEECGQDMKERFGLTHWIPAYPLHLMRKDAEVKSVYAACEGNQIVATFTVGTQAPAYCDMALWESPDANALYVNRLAVLPAHQSRGIGTWCMNAIEQLAIAEQSTAVRLDAYDKHEKLHEFYRRLGYQQRGILRFNTKLYGQTGAVFFEKIIAQHPVALITGGSRGIGAATALALADLGYDAAITYRNKAARANEVIATTQVISQKAASGQDVQPLPPQRPAQAPLP